MVKNLPTKFLNIEISKSTKKQLKDLKYWLDETFINLIERLVKKEWELVKPKSS
ncbi:MAG: hypothetical protein [Thorarchaeia virus VerdaV2]|uniref:Uncharacterized protein n=1 Tax=Thorarchaeia virus VerdaV2 TaxID=3070171 RepID=A0AA35CPI5_9CAUD|nr:MAG: hypothetical protein QIT42_gp30 [Thorarchaeia virus VerdaV2]BDI54924.1 MAG: hypothetical protein [Thorarchaeia virus VerdaV2]